MKVDDLTGRRFGRWTVLKQVPIPEYHAETCAFWLCRCDCGTEKVVSAKNLKKGATNSCGCLRKELLKRRWANDKRQRRADAV